MKKLFAICVVASLSAATAFAQGAIESTSADAQKDQQKVEKYQAPKEKASWPVWLAFNDTKNIDVIGLRLTIPYGKCENVTGFDMGLFGRCEYFNGLAVNILRNHVIDGGSGIQIGLYNTFGGIGKAIALQIGLWNEANYFQGAEVGIINVCDSGAGFQVGLINRAESFYGFQIGAVNVIRGSDVPFLPLINVGF